MRQQLLHPLNLQLNQFHKICLLPRDAAVAAAAAAFAAAAVAATVAAGFHSPLHRSPEN